MDIVSCLCPSQLTEQNVKLLCCPSWCSGHYGADSVCSVRCNILLPPPSRSRSPSECLFGENSALEFNQTKANRSVNLDLVVMVAYLSISLVQLWAAPTWRSRSRCSKSWQPFPSTPRMDTHVHCKCWTSSRSVSIYKLFSHSHIHTVVVGVGFCCWCCYVQ